MMRARGTKVVGFRAVLRTVLLLLLQPLCGSSLSLPQFPSKSRSPSPPPPTLPPPPPWTFRASGLHYRLTSVPVDVALRTPALWKVRDGDEDVEANLRLLSLNGRTLGGVFVVDWTDSPVGPYREVALLSCLVGGGRKNQPWWSWAIGAWASHIFVDSEAAAAYGRSHWGLPATVAPIEFADDGGNDDVASVVSFSSDGIVRAAVGLGETRDDADDAGSSFFRWPPRPLPIDVFLPSFSGRLPSDGDENTGVVAAAATPLLRYSLQIRRPEFVSPSSPSGSVVRCEWPATNDSTTTTTDDDGPFGSDQDRALLKAVAESPALLAFDVGPVELVAGVPERLSS